MLNDNSICIAKKVILKAFVEELYRKKLIDFIQFNNIVGTIDECIDKLNNNIIKNNMKKNIIVKILIWMMEEFDIGFIFD